MLIGANSRTIDRRDPSNQASNSTVRFRSGNHCDSPPADPVPGRYVRKNVPADGDHPHYRVGVGVCIVCDTRTRTGGIAGNGQSE